MLVDDNPTFLRILSRYLQQYDEVTVVGTAGGVEEAVAKAEHLRPQLILLDLAMPGVSGLDAIPRLRRTLPEVSIIALTLLETDGYRQAALRAGANEFVPKAVMSAELLPAIRRVIPVHDGGGQT
jgi:DNA-binding NarL/FixJ family response regulator